VYTSKGLKNFVNRTIASDEAVYDMHVILYVRMQSHISLVELINIDYYRVSA